MGLSYTLRNYQCLRSMFVVFPSTLFANNLLFTLYVCGPLLHFPIFSTSEVCLWYSTAKFFMITTPVSQ